ncbi:MAG: SDR family oxidoreductase [Proteobacteria bacterium]|nr:SDR family oxidoreductase [Pseudomonadota bacterium]
MAALPVGGRVVLVTGTSTGFGRVIAAGLAADGYRVFGTTRADAGPADAGVTRVVLDVTRDDSVAQALAVVLEAAGRIDAVVNNAGMGIAGAIEDTTVVEAQAQFDTNFFGLHRVCRAVLPHLRARGAGHIINMSSLAGQVPLPFQGFYSASKFAIEAYSESLRMELRAHGVAVSMVEPGDFATGFTANRRMTAASGPGSPYHEACRGAIERMARDELANRDLSPVLGVVRRILRTSRPALRYPCATFVQRAFVAVRPFLPQPLAEFAIRDTYGLRS